MNKGLTGIHFVCFVWLVAQGQAMAQLTPFPSWGNSPVEFRSLDIEPSHPVNASLVDCYKLWRETHTVNLEDFEFRHNSTTGIIAVSRWDNNSQTIAPVGGLDTGLQEVLFLDGVAENALPQLGGPRLLLWCGRDVNGISRIGCLPVVAGSRPSAAHVTAIDATSLPGEVWTVVSLLGDRLYVLDGARATVLRFTCSTGSSRFDLRDPGFSVVIPSHLRHPLLRFDPVDAERIALRGGLDYASNWQVLLTMNMRISREPIAPGALAEAVPVSPYIYAGVGHIATVGGVGRSYRIEKSASASGTYVPITSVTIPNGVGVTLFSLDSPIASGEWIRIMEVSVGPGPPVMVLPAAPIIHDLSGADALGQHAPGSTIHVQGGNLATGEDDASAFIEPRVVMNGSIPTYNGTPIPLEVVASGASDWKVVLPNLPSLSGTLVLTTALGPCRRAIKIGTY